MVVSILVSKYSSSLPALIFALYGPFLPIFSLDLRIFYILYLLYPGIFSLAFSRTFSRLSLYPNFLRKCHWLQGMLSIIWTHEPPRQLPVSGLGSEGYVDMSLTPRESSGRTKHLLEQRIIFSKDSNARCV